MAVMKKRMVVEAVHKDGKEVRLDFNIKTDDADASIIGIKIDSDKDYIGVVNLDQANDYIQKVTTSDQVRLITEGWF
jgi:hypothetical protein